ncbi:MAG: glycosyltransferase [Nitrospinaceae bacterium]|nr:glycosyltransferase [Nitrospinaceae bacterium]NIR53468.1 glycosyltransferase [Nitrospinaceae bacterium]NIT80664.1 glycosyltransferase [Nitrospinaceae bacterium]NIX33068.1 glycosyltransferase [Nitrospinaceae bacterium]NIY13688.1 glycosyltransferase [Nitrospinaceae bacterium]
MNQDVPYKELELPRMVLVWVFLFVALWYLIWRFGTLNPEARIFSYLLYAAELFGFFTVSMHLFMTWRLTERKAPPPSEGLDVDVFITTINEPVSLLRRTLIHAMKMSYPHKTWLLDDGRRPEMAELAKEMGCHYLSRPDNRDAKAGNLNHGLQNSQGELVVVFDADHAPNENFLMQTLGYFKDDSVAFVQTPQDFYNLDSFQHHNQKNKPMAWHEQSVFFRVIQRGKDYWNATFFCGSCAVLRRSALEAVGGFATGSVTEDLHTSLKLHKKGFRSVYHAEPLAFGLAPSSMVSFLKQRIRWGQGAMQIWRKEGVFFCRGLTMPQRINYLASSITYFDGWQKAFFYVAPAIVLTTGLVPLKAQGLEFLFHFVPYFLLSYWVFEEVNRGNGRSLVIEQYNMARFASMAWSTLAFFSKHLSFSVTSKEASQQSVAWWCLAPQVLILTLNLLALPIGFALYRYYHVLPLDAMLVCMIWSAVNLALSVSVLMFSKNRSRFRRTEYRFPIPLPASLVLTNSTSIEVFGVIDDISSTGFRFYAPIPKSVKKGHSLKGKIYLPTGPLSIEAEIKSLIPGNNHGEHYVKAIGCRLKMTRELESELALFLYGSDLQRRMSDLQETIRTPIDHFYDLAAGAKMRKRLIHWAPISYTVGDSKPEDTQVGLIGVDSEASSTKEMLVFSPLPEKANMHLNLHSRGRVSKLSGTVGTGKRTDVSSFSIYSYDLIPEHNIEEKE